MNDIYVGIEAIGNHKEEQGSLTDIIGNILFEASKRSGLYSVLGTMSGLLEGKLSRNFFWQELQFTSIYKLFN